MEVRSTPSLSDKSSKEDEVAVKTKRPSKLHRALPSRSDADFFRYFNRNKLDYPNEETTRQSRKYVKAMKQLSVWHLLFIYDSSIP